MNREVGLFVYIRYDRVNHYRDVIVSNQHQNSSEKASFFYTIKSVLWAMLGVRRAKGYDEDVTKITAKQAIVVGIFAVLAFIMTLYFVVSLVIGRATS